MEEDEIGYKELTDPNSPHFTRDWYFICEIPDLDPWARIIDQLFAIEFFASQLKKKEVIHKKEKIYQTEAKSKVQKDILKVQGSDVLNLLEIVKEHISCKNVDLDFVTAWGELQLAFTKVQIAYPHFITQQKSGKGGKINNKAMQYQWYALWYLQRGKLSRNLLNKQLERIYKGISNGQTLIPEGWTKSSLERFMNPLRGTDNTNFKISTGFGATNFKKPAILSSAKAGQGNKNLPPVGVAHYIK